MMFVSFDSKATGVTRETGIANPSGAPKHYKDIFCLLLILLILTEMTTLHKTM